MRKLIIAIVAAVGLILGLASCSADDKPAENWNPINVSIEGSIEGIDCDKIESAKRQVEAAVQAVNDDEADETKLTELGLWKEGAFNKVAYDGDPQKPEGSTEHKGVKLRLQERYDSSACKDWRANEATSTQSDCANGFVVKLDGNAGGNLFSGGISPKSDEAKKQVLAKAKEDPRVLQVYYNASPRGQKTGVIEKVEDIAPLKNGACYTEQGRKWYEAWASDWELVEIKNDKLPANGTNTGAVPNGQAFQSQGAIPDGTAYLVVYYDAAGNEIGRYWIRIECGNPVSPTPFPGIGGPPPGAPPIVTPPPPGPPPVTPPPTTPPPPTTLDDKGPQATRIPGQPGANGDGGASQHGGNGDSRGNVGGQGPSAPAAGQPPAQAPAPQPVPTVPQAPPAGSTPTTSNNPPPAGEGNTGVSDGEVSPP